VVFLHPSIQNDAPALCEINCKGIKGGLPNISHKGRPMRADEMTFFQIQRSSFSSAMMSFVPSPFSPKAPQKILNLVPKTRQKIAHLAN
jgi:hypothetical protein